MWPVLPKKIILFKLILKRYSLYEISRFSVITRMLPVIGTSKIFTTKRYEVKLDNVFPPNSLNEQD